MSLKARLTSFDCIVSLDAARRDRHWEAMTCVTEEIEFIACYLYGYVAEMTLKCAYFRFLNIPLADDLKPYLKAAQQQVRRHRGRNLHDVRAWADLLIEARKISGKPLDPVQAGMLLYEAATVEDHWSEAMRYQPAMPALTEATEMDRAVGWMLDQYSALWR